MSTNSSARRGLLRNAHVQALLLFTVLALVLTWPLAAHFTTHVPGDGIDDPALAWNLWWIKARLVDQLNFDIFHADWMFYPIQINLGFYTLTPLNGLLSVPLQTSLSLIIANNLILLSSFVLGGFGAYLVGMCRVMGKARSRHRTVSLCRPLRRDRLRLRLVQAVLRGLGPSQYCQQPVGAVYGAFCPAHGGEPQSPCRLAQRWIRRPLPRPASLGGVDVCVVFVDFYWGVFCLFVDWLLC